MPSIIDSLVISLGFDISGFTKGQKEIAGGLKVSRDEANKTGKEMEAAGKRASSFFSSIRTELLALVGLSLSVQGFKNFVTGMTNDLMQLGITSRSLDMSAKSLDGWRRAAEAAGSSAEKITGTFSSFQSTLTKIRSGQAGDDPLFAALSSFAGATGANFDYKNDNAEAIMRKIAQNWNKLNKDAKRQYGSMLGFDNVDIQGLDSGQLVTDADHFAKISKATVDATKKALDFNRQLSEMKQSFSAASQVLYIALLPYVRQLIPLIEKIGTWIATHHDEIVKFFSDTSTEVNHVVDAVGGWQHALEILLAFVAGRWAIGMLTAVGRVAKGFGPLLAIIAAVDAFRKADAVQDEAKRRGLSVSGVLQERMKSKQKEGDSFTDSVVKQIADLYHRLTGGEAGNYDTYGTATNESYGDGYKRTGTPRGIRNNNPGNLNYAGQAGATIEGGPNGRFAVFGSMADGIAALYRQIQIYFSRGTNTIESIVKKYAPAGDGNDVFSYINSLVKSTGKGANEILSSSDMSVIFKLLKGIIGHENGSGYITDNQLMSGIQLGASANIDRNSLRNSSSTPGNQTYISI